MGDWCCQGDRLIGRPAVGRGGFIGSTTGLQCRAGTPGLVDVLECPSGCADLRRARDHDQLAAEALLQGSTGLVTYGVGMFTSPPASRHAARSLSGSTNTTVTEGIPTTACSARPITNRHAPHHAPPSRDRRTRRPERGMTPTEAASLPLIPLDPRRARLRARPSGLKGRCPPSTRRTHHQPRSNP
jgi:hypothetical protein